MNTDKNILPYETTDGIVVPFLITKEQFLVAAKNVLSPNLYKYIEGEDIPDFLHTTITLEKYDDVEPNEIPAMIVSKDAFVEKCHKVHNHQYDYSLVKPIMVWDEVETFED